MKQLKWNKIKCIVYDFDGVMTDNRVLVSQDGKESVFVNRSDGWAIARFRELGIRQLILSTEENPVVMARAKKLKLEVLQGISDKGEILSEWCSKQSIPLKNVLYIGNDLNDLPAFKVVGFKGSPKDAELEMLEQADWVSEKNGGYGVIRDLYRCIVETAEKNKE